MHQQETFYSQKRYFFYGFGVDFDKYCFGVCSGMFYILRDVFILGCVFFFAYISLIIRFVVKGMLLCFPDALISLVIFDFRFY